MTKPSKPVADKKAPKPKSKRKSSDEARRRVIQDHIDGLKAFLRRLRQQLH